jgi:hypothetical protein
MRDHFRLVGTWLQRSRLVLALPLLVALSGCGSLFYSKTPTGSFSGKLTVEWIAPNQFIYRPDKVNPLIYVASDGHKIQPELMYTDGGSIPRLLWSAPGLGPWDFGPGYIIHDWLFEQHHCKVGDWAAFDFPKSAAILAEALKTQMVKTSEPDASLVYVIYEAVRSPIAEKLWNESPCKPPTFSSTPIGGAAPPIVLFTVEAK